MVELTSRFASWLERHDDTEQPATPAATVLVLRDADGGPEVLMVQRNAEGSFASNWVFPGGKVDPDDFDGDGDIIGASRRAAAREAFEEADIVVGESGLVPFSHWMPPVIAPRRFSTWFFLTASPGGVDADVTVDGGEIVDHVWVRPAEALRRHAAGNVDLVPPTWMTLRELGSFDSCSQAIERCRSREPFFYLTKLLRNEHPTVAWHGDAGYDSGDGTVTGSRHRLEMDPAGWRFEGPER